MVVGDAVIYGTDAQDGEAGLFSRRKETGELISALVLDGLGNQRSSIAYADGTVYFTTSSGYLCSAAVGSDGTLSDLLSVKNEGVTASTSTPVVYDDVVYYGANGKLVAADAATLQTLREVSFPSAAGVQSSALLTTAYASSENGAVYLYLTQNITPGCLYVAKDIGTALTLSTLYTPDSEDYCLISVICDEDGTLYYHNDAGYLIAVEVKEPAGCPVEFSVIPADATVTVTGEEPIAGRSYDLAAGTYSYSVSRDDYLTKTGSFTVSDDEATGHTSKTLSVSLASDQTQGGTESPSTISVKVSVKMHETDGDKTYTYKSNRSAYSNLVSETISLASGSTVFDALDAALTEADVSYNERDYGYIDAIDGISEFDYGDHSGWLYMVNGTVATVGCRAYTLTSRATIVWFYTDDYTQEYGSENWSSGSGGKTQSATVSKTPAVTDGSASATASVGDMADAIEAVQEAGEGNITIAVIPKQDAASVSLSVKKSSLNSMVAGTDAALEVQTPVGTAELSNDTLASIVEQANGSEVIITMEQKNQEQIDALVAANEALSAQDVENAAVVSVSIVSDETSITRFDEGNTIKLTLSVDDSYTKGDTYKVIVVSDDGTVQTLSGTVSKTDDGLAVTLGLSHLSTFVITHQPAASFADVAADAWYADAVAFTVANDLFTGTSAATFEPDAQINRAMFVTVLYRLAGEPAVTSANPFTDVADGQWYTDAVIWASESGITSGYGGGVFGVTDSMTRQQMAAMLLRYAQDQQLDVNQSKDLSAFTDAAAIADWALDAMQWANAEGLITGATQDTLVPQGSATRAEVATILMRFVEQVIQ